MSRALSAVETCFSSATSALPRGEHRQECSETPFLHLLLVPGGKGAGAGTSLPSQGLGSTAPRVCSSLPCRGGPHETRVVVGHDALAKSRRQAQADPDPWSLGPPGLKKIVPRDVPDVAGCFTIPSVIILRPAGLFVVEGHLRRSASRSPPGSAAPRQPGGQADQFAPAAATSASCAPPTYIAYHEQGAHPTVASADGSCCLISLAPPTWRRRRSTLGLAPPVRTAGHCPSDHCPVRWRCGLAGRATTRPARSGSRIAGREQSNDGDVDEHPPLPRPSPIIFTSVSLVNVKPRNTSVVLIAPAVVMRLARPADPIGTRLACAVPRRPLVGTAESGKTL